MQQAGSLVSIVTGLAITGQSQSELEPAQPFPPAVFVTFTALFASHPPPAFSFFFRFLSSTVPHMPRVLEAYL